MARKPRIRDADLMVKVLRTVAQERDLSSGRKALLNDAAATIEHTKKLQLLSVAALDKSIKTLEELLR